MILIKLTDSEKRCVRGSSIIVIAIGRKCMTRKIIHCKNTETSIKSSVDKSSSDLN